MTTKTTGSHEESALATIAQRLDAGTTVPPSLANLLIDTTRRGWDTMPISGEPGRSYESTKLATLLLAVEKRVAAFAGPEERTPTLDEILGHDRDD